jgi:hypothetical protein
MHTSTMEAMARMDAVRCREQLYLLTVKGSPYIKRGNLSRSAFSTSGGTRSVTGP